MYYAFLRTTRTTSFLLAAMALLFFTACDDDSTSVGPEPDPMEASFSYAFNEGQAVGDVNTAYRGSHDRNVTADLVIEEMEDGNAAVTVTLNNTLDGETYAVHAHDMADPSTTPNNTPYNETPNADVFAELIDGTGGSAELTHETELPYTEVANEYEGFFVVHDPLQPIDTADLSTYLVLGVFGQSLEAGESSLRSAEYEYAFNEGQLLGDFAYDGSQGDHPRNLTATLSIEERGTGAATVTVTLENTLDGADYAVHAHDVADPDTTPNNTPYNETPNADVYAQLITGTGGSVSQSFESDEAYTDLVEVYEGFFVVHDPTQPVDTTDPSTYLVLGTFAESLEAGDPNQRAVTITMGNEGASAYIATDVDGAPAEDVVALNESNAPVTLQEGMRYQFVIENGGSHPFGVDDDAGTTLLNHDGTGSFADDEAVNLMTDGEGGLSFNLTSELAAELAAYYCNFHGSMRGDVMIADGE